MRYSVYVLVAVFFCSGCNLFNSDKEVIITSIAEELRLDLWNPLATPSKFALAFSTLDPACPGTEISASHSQVGKTINIAIHGLLENTNCIDGGPPAQRYIPINIGPGQYDLVLRIGPEIVNTGTVTFDSAVYKISMHTNVGLILGHTELHRIPFSVVWGVLSSDMEADSEFEQLEQELAPLGIQPDLSSGYYGHFAINSDGSLTFTESLGYAHEYPFVLALDGSLDELGNVLDSFRAQLDPKMQLLCTSWDGTEL